MSFTYNLGIPATNNNPTTDQPNMKINNDAIASIIAVDHVGFNASNGGKHNQVTFPAENVPGSPPASGGVLYTGPGVADATHPVMNFQNANLVFPVSLIRAYAVFTAATGTISATQKINVASVTRFSAGVYDIVLNANVTTNTDYSVFVTGTGQAAVSVTFAVTISGATTFRITYGTGLSEPTTISFIVTQL